MPMKGPVANIPKLVLICPHLIIFSTSIPNHSAFLGLEDLLSHGSSLFLISISKRVYKRFG